MILTNRGRNKIGWLPHGRGRRGSPLGLALLVVLAGSSPSRAQGLVETAGGGVVRGEAVVLTVDGQEVAGSIASVTFKGESMTSFSLRHESGDTTKFRAEDVASLEVALDKLMQLTLISENLETIGKVVKGDFAKAVRVDRLIFHRIPLPKKPEVLRLHQLLNPGFDRAIKVYPHSGMLTESGTWSMGSLAVAGGNDKSYLILKGGPVPVIVKKGAYKKLFAQIFGDCAAMMDFYADEKPKFKHLAEHVWVYDQLCADSGSSADSEAWGASASSTD